MLQHGPQSIPYLQNNLRKVQHPTGEAYNKLSFAFSYSKSRTKDEFKKSIPIFASVAANKNCPDACRARAVEALTDLS